VLTLFLRHLDNYVGFDPRGVGQSGPSVDCFPGNPVAKAQLAPSFIRPVNSQDPISLSQEFAKAGAYGDWCSRVHSSPNSGAKYANTPAVAADMLNYAEKAAILKGEKKGDAKLWYYGLSYGTVLGATFATLFPERVGRIILDGVMDSEVYYTGKWDENVAQSDEAVGSFFTYCHLAGPDKCAVYSNSTELIKARLDSVIADVRKNPVQVSDPAFVEFPTIVTYEILNFVLLSVLYAPSQYFPMFAQIFADLERRNGSLIATVLPRAKATADSVGAMILCMDAVGRYNLSTPELWEAHVERVVAKSSYIGDSWASISLICRNLRITPPKSQQFNTLASANNTASPILFIGNTVDPVTPIKMARKMSGLFGGSKVLEVRGVGHCSISAFSTCTASYIQRYLADGSLPKEGTVCEPEGLPFGNGMGISL